jgi:hypothetical protein
MTNNNRMGTEDIAMSRLGAALGPSLAEQLEQRPNSSINRRLHEGGNRGSREWPGL